MKNILLSTAYLPPIQYISKFLTGLPVYIEYHENYQKQSYRNRCCIYGANGPLILVIPVKKLHREKMPVATVEIDYTTDWKRIHLKSIESAYRLSAYYEYYVDDITDAFKAEITSLLDWNLHMLKVILKLCEINAVAFNTETWEPGTSNDFRNAINPKKRLNRTDPFFTPPAYQQVFADRHGFLPNLSIIDLLFNSGPQTLQLLKSSISA